MPHQSSGVEDSEDEQSDEVTAASSPLGPTVPDFSPILPTGPEKYPGYHRELEQAYSEGREVQRTYASSILSRQSSASFFLGRLELPQRRQHMLRRACEGD